MAGMLSKTAERLVTGTGSRALAGASRELRCLCLIVFDARSEKPARALMEPEGLWYLSQTAGASRFP